METKKTPSPQQLKDSPVCLVGTQQSLSAGARTFKGGLSSNLLTRSEAKQLDKTQYHPVYFFLTTLSPKKPVMK